MISYFDMQSSALLNAWKQLQPEVYSLNDSKVDVEKLLEGGCAGQVFSIAMLSPTLKQQMGALFPNDDDFIKKLTNIFHVTLGAHDSEIAMARNLSDFMDNRRNCKMSAFLAIRDGRFVDGDFKKIRRVHKTGVRMLGIMGDLPNCFGVPSSDGGNGMKIGLTPFGKKAVEFMDELGMVVDVAHLSNQGILDVLEIGRKPIVASHVNARALSPHNRNLGDDMIKSIGDKGGLIGVSFLPYILNSDLTQENSTIERIGEHMRHIANVGGIDCVGIGSNLDGFEVDYPLDNCSKMQSVFETLDKAGFTEDEIEKIAYNNFLRIVKESMK